MSFDALVHSVLRRITRTVRHDESEATPYQANTSKLTTRLLDVFLRTFDLGFSAFGGPPVHFQIFHKRFVDGLGKTPWIDEQTYQELFAISQALPGPASTKMLFSIAHIHAGIIPALFVFLLWCLPGAVAMYGLSLGVQRIGETLPGPAYALLSGINAATVGIIALAAVQLAKKAITDPLTRSLVLFGACFGLCYNALWYFPVLLVFAGLVTVAWDGVGQTLLRKWRNKKRAKKRSSLPPEREAGTETSIPMEDIKTETNENPSAPAQPARIDISAHGIRVKFGIVIIIFFFVLFTLLMVLRGTLHHSPLLLALFNNMFLAGTIIFGGGPVVIPLLRDYVVGPGWVSPRDFLLGLAVIQALPGPNFNFAIYLGALVVAGPAESKSIPTIVGAILGFLGIFTPGLWLSIGFQSIWQSLRKRREVVSILRGVNAAAVGFVFTAVYRLWEIGYLTAAESQGISLGQEPFWLVIAATTFTFVEWFSVPPAVAIIGGGTAGLAWWGAVGRHFTH
ncbi:chromate transporter-domain-containing protein [Flammula alnicola]|nr:chromate transporter-domain-containing protein [Flammula alnicola]